MSGWGPQGRAHEAYLVAVHIDDDAEFRAELTRLSQSFGIGAVQLDPTEPVDSQVLLAARERSEVDWKTIDRIAALNPDLRDFVSSVTKSVKINQPALQGFDKVFSDSELEAYLKLAFARRGRST